MQPLPQNANELLKWTWADIQPYYTELTSRPLDRASLESWLSDWSRISERVDELYNRLYIATTVNTSDGQAEQQYNQFLDTTFSKTQQAEEGLKEKLLKSELALPGFEIQLRNMRAESALYREANLPLMVEEQKLVSEYNKITGGLSVEWQGQERTLQQLQPDALNPDRSVRERAWRLSMQRWLQERQPINGLWQKLYQIRQKIASNAGLSSYRTYRWQQLERFDYTPEDAKCFHAAIEEVAVPAARRVLEKRRKQLGVERLRPWDLEVDPLGRPALHPFSDVEQLKERVSSMFHHFDPQLAAYFDQMVHEGLLDLDNRKNKAPGGYCNTLAAARIPFIFMNAVGLHDDVQTLLHESGHAFHVFETASLPYFQQLNTPSEFSEVASMGMELLASPYLPKKDGGFYTQEETARARAEHLYGIILFWPYMAVVDAFQHWAYEHPDHAMNASACDTEWGELWQRFMPVVDWSGLEDAMVTGWHRKLHILTLPFYYIEYGLAQLGAVQVFRNSLDYPAQAIAAYRHALSLGNTLPLPALYQAAGARLAFDSQTLGEAVLLIETLTNKLSG